MIPTEVLAGLMATVVLPGATEGRTGTIGGVTEGTIRGEIEVVTIIPPELTSRVPCVCVCVVLIAYPLCN